MEMETRRRPSTPTSSDSDLESETLIHQPQTKPPTSIFQIDSSSLRRLLSDHRKPLLLSVLVLVVLALLFSLDLRPLFRSVPKVFSSPDGKLREAELKALYLIRSQNAGLLKLWNRTTSFGSGFNSSSSRIVSMEEFRSALMEQIQLNREIEKTLLSPHRAGNVSEDADFGFSLSDFSEGICRKKEKPLERRMVEWKPKKDRYLFAICVSGQMSNHLICLEKHMFFAALLDRVLVLPSPKFDYQYDRVIDVDHINDCFGRKVVISFEEFEGLKKNKMKVDRFICYMAKPPCFVDEEHVKRLKGLGLSLPKLKAAWPEDAKLNEPKKRVAGDITSKFTCEDEVLAIGDTFYADVEEEWVMQPGGPLAHKCKTVIRPSRLITQTAERFVQTFLGKNFVALHFRRHGFLKFCNVKEQSCFFPIPQAAECILRVVQKANAPVIYLSTDAAESETGLLQTLVVLNEKTVPLVKRPSHTSVEKWDALLYRNHIGGDNQVEAMLDKTICALSSVFIGSSGSTFTEDIFRLRKDWGSASVCDEYLCQGEQPNFIASNE